MRNLEQNNENNTDNEKIKEILEELNNGVFSKESWDDSDFYKITEMTYSYDNFDDSILNLTLFEKGGELNVKEFQNADIERRKELIDMASENVVGNINEKKKKIEGGLNSLKLINTDDVELNARKEIIEGGLQETLDLLELPLLGIEFEKEKALVGLHFQAKEELGIYCMTDDDRNIKQAKIDEINERLFGKKLSEHEQYTKGSIDYFYTKYEKYKSEIEKNEISKERILSDDEQKRYETYLKKLGNLSPGYDAKKIVSPKKTKDKSWGKIKMFANDLQKSFNFHYRALNKQTHGMSHVAYIDDKIGGMTDTPKGLGQPESVEYKFIDEESRLQGHEIGQHSVALETHMGVLESTIRGAKNLELAEGTACLGEDMFDFGKNLYIDAIREDGEKVKIIDINKLGYVPSFSKTIMEEILSDEEFYDFMELQNKIEPDTTSPLNRYLRLKRNGSQKKDTVYTTGKLKAAEYYNKIVLGEVEGDFSDLYEGKVGFDEIKKFQFIKNSKQLEYNKHNNEIDSQIKRIEEEIKGIISEGGDNLKIEKKKGEITGLHKSKKGLAENLLFNEAVYFSVKIREEKNKLIQTHGKIKGKKLIREQNLKVTGENFYNYLQENYPQIDFKEDIIREKIDGITFGFKAQLLGAIKLHEKSIDNHGIDVSVKNVEERV